MVAAAGAGPRPVHHKQLDKENLTAAIQKLIAPATRDAAKRISETMETENGVKRAVQSFHQHLPKEMLTCDLLPGEPAAWAFDAKSLRAKDKKRFKRGLRISSRALSVLSQHQKLDLTKVRLYGFSPQVQHPCPADKRYEDLTNEQEPPQAGRNRQQTLGSSDRHIICYTWLGCRFLRGFRKSCFRPSERHPTPDSQAAEKKD